MNDRKSIEILTCMLEVLYQLNAKGYYTAWLDWSGHTGGIYVKIIKGKWQKGKKEKVVFEALICTRFSKWKDSYSGKDFELSEFMDMVQQISDNRHTPKVNSKEHRYEKAQT